MKNLHLDYLSFLNFIMVCCYLIYWGSELFHVDPVLRLKTKYIFYLHLKQLFFDLYIES